MAASQDEGGQLRALYHELAKAAYRAPGTVPWRMLPRGAQVGAEFDVGSRSLILTVQRCGISQADAVAKFGNEVSVFLREFQITRQVVAQRIVDERHLPERSLRWICQVAPKTVEPDHGQ
jgi:hypothetical protein